MDTPAGEKLREMLAGASALVFDLDGVLVLTDRLKYESYRRACAALGRELDFGFYRALIGRSRPATCRAIVEHLALAVSPGELAELREAQHGRVYAEFGVEAIPAARRLLAALPRERYRLGLVSSSTRDRVEAALAALEFRFDAAVSGEGLPAKPAPDLYLRCFREMGVAAERALVFEDSADGLAAARAAGARCVAVPAEATRAQDLSAAEVRLESLDRVRELLP